MLHTPFFNPEKSYEENWKEGPFGAFADGKIYVEKGDPTFDFFGHKVYTPFGIPAGPLLNGKFVKAALDKGFNIPMHKTVRTKKRQSNAWPNVLSVKVQGDLTLERAQSPLIADNNYEEPLSITNSFGNPSYDPDIWQPDLKDAVMHAKKGQVVTASYEGTDWDKKGETALIADWILGARLLKETGVALIEMNFSCPNEGVSSLLCFDVVRSQKIATAVKNEIGNTPLAVKMPYFAPDLLPDFVKKVGSIVDVLSCINTIPAPIVDKDGAQALPGEGRKVGGVCGSAIKWAGVDMTKRLIALRENLRMKYMVISTGGVTTPADYAEYKNAGADVVMSATGAMWNPYLAEEIKKTTS